MGRPGCRQSRAPRGHPVCLVGWGTALADDPRALLLFGPTVYVIVIAVR